jgi:hypothetical protein
VLSICFGLQAKSDRLNLIFWIANKTHRHYLSVMARRRATAATVQQRKTLQAEHSTKDRLSIIFQLLYDMLGMVTLLT